MTLRDPYRPLRPDLDGFLFSQVGDERHGVPLSMISALTRLGLDPWEEAARLSSLNKREAVEQLARLIVELPDRPSPLPEARRIAGELVERLPKFGGGSPAARQFKHPQRRRWSWSIPRLSAFDALCIGVGLMALLSILMHGGF